MQDVDLPHLETVTRQNIRMVQGAGVKMTERDGSLHFDDEGFDDFCRRLAMDQVSYVSKIKLFRVAVPFDSHLKGDDVHLNEPKHVRLRAALSRHLQCSGFLGE